VELTKWKALAPAEGSIFDERVCVYRATCLQVVPRSFRKRPVAAATLIPRRSRLADPPVIPVGKKHDSPKPQRTLELQSVFERVSPDGGGL
jgi:hypothetical protein